MENRIRKLASRIRAIKSKSVRPRYPAALKHEVLAVYQAAGKRLEVLRRLGLGYTTVAVWLRAEAVRPTGSGQTFKSISVAATPSPRPILVFSNGISVENLSEEFLTKVLAHAFSTR